MVDHIKGLYVYFYSREDKKLVLIGRSIDDALENQIGMIIDEETYLLNKEDAL